MLDVTDVVADLAPIDRVEIADTEDPEDYRTADVATFKTQVDKNPKF